MGEAIAGVVGRLRQQPRRDGPLAMREQLVLAQFGRRRPGRQRHLLPDNRRDREQPLRPRGQPGEPPRDHLPQQRRHRRRGQVADLPVVARWGEQPLPLERAQQLAEEEGVALGPPG